jgi:hypothetical protein
VATERTSGAGCPGGTACATYMLTVPASNPLVGTFTAAGTAYAGPAGGNVSTTSMRRRLASARLVRSCARQRVWSRLRWRSVRGQCLRQALWPSRDAMRAPDHHFTRVAARNACQPEHSVMLTAQRDSFYKRRFSWLTTRRERSVSQRVVGSREGEDLLKASGRPTDRQERGHRDTGRAGDGGPCTRHARLGLPVQEGVVEHRKEVQQGLHGASHQCSSTRPESPPASLPARRGHYACEENLPQ